VTVHTREIRRRVGEDNLVRIAAEDIADRLNADDQPYLFRRDYLLTQAVTLAADIEELLDERPADVERLTVQSARSSEYALRRKLEAVRMLVVNLKAL